MAICRFCGQEFISAQAVRAHLKGCEAYRNRPAKPEAAASLRHASLGSASVLGNAWQAVDASPGAEFDPVRQLEQRLAAEQLRLKLRELEEAHRELDARARAKAEEQRRASEREAEAVRAGEREREATRLREAQASQERQRQESGQHQLKATRREIIQQVKRETVEHWVDGLWVGAELKAQMLQEIERALAPTAYQIPHPPAPIVAPYPLASPSGGPSGGLWGPYGGLLWGAYARGELIRVAYGWLRRGLGVAYVWLRHRRRREPGRHRGLGGRDSGARRH